WSSDVCSSDLNPQLDGIGNGLRIAALVCERVVEELVGGFLGGVDQGLENNVFVIAVDVEEGFDFGQVDVEPVFNSTHRLPLLVQPALFHRHLGVRLPLMHDQPPAGSELPAAAVDRANPRRHNAAVFTNPFVLGLRFLWHYGLRFGGPGNSLAANDLRQSPAHEHPGAGRGDPDQVSPPNEPFGARVGRERLHRHHGDYSPSSAGGSSNAGGSSKVPWTKASGR